MCVWGALHYREMSDVGLRAILGTFRDTNIFDDEDVGLVEEELQAQAMVADDVEIKALEMILPQRQAVIRALDAEHQLTRKYPLMMLKLAQKQAKLEQLLAEKKKARDDLIAFRRGVRPQ